MDEYKGFFVDGFGGGTGFIFCGNGYGSPNISGNIYGEGFGSFGYGSGGANAYTYYITAEEITSFRWEK